MDPPESPLHCPGRRPSATTAGLARFYARSPGTPTGGPLAAGDRFNPLTLGVAPSASRPHAHGAATDRALPQPAEDDAGRSPGRGSFPRLAGEAMRASSSSLNDDRAEVYTPTPLGLAGWRPSDGHVHLI